MNNGKVCFIFFSGNGLYYPNDYPTAIDALITRNHYEWKNISQSDFIKCRAGKIIFVRDVYKHWYINGINSRVNSMPKLFEFLQEKTAGYEVVTAGNSAGGYMAALFGAFLQAKLVLNFSGQYVLDLDELSGYYYMQKYKYDSSRSRYLNIIPFIKQAPNVPIMYFFPAYSEQDQKQYNLVKDIKNVFSFKFAQSVHGATMHGLDMPCVISTDFEILQMLHSIFKDTIIDSNLFSLNLYYLHTMEYFKLKVQQSPRYIGF